MQARALFGLPLLLVAMPSGGETVEGLHFEHHDWELACDNTRTCRMAGYQVEEGSAPLSVLFTRPGGPDSAVTAQLQLGSVDEPPAGAVDGVIALQVEINGKPVGALKVPTDSYIADLPETATEALLAALPGSAPLRFVGSEQQWQLSSRGASAVLLKMDEFQGRLGTPGALLRKGEGDEEAVPSALPKPRVVQVAIDGAPLPDLAADSALQEALKAALADDEDCDRELLDEHEPQVLRIDARRALASLTCWRGAYNEGSAYWVIATTPPYLPQLVSTSISEAEGALLTAAHKGRGIGDCWSRQDWVWDGTRFVLTTVATGGMCRMVALGGAWELPTRVSDVVPIEDRD